MTGKPFNFGVLGASNFAAGTMAPAIHAAQGVRLAALASQNAAGIARFAAFCPDLRVHDSYEALLADPEIDAVYIPLPNHLHVEWALKANAAGKHVLCEKPIALKTAEIDRLIAARDASGLQLAEAYMIVHHPQWHRAKALLAEGAIGDLRHVDGVFSFPLAEGQNIRNRPETGGGALRDVGVYPIGATRFATGAEPVSIRAAQMEFVNGIDTYTNFSADFGSFTLNTMVSIRMAARQEMVFHGTKGVMRLNAAFTANVVGLPEVALELADNRLVVERFANINQYVLQVQAFCFAARNGTPYAWPLEQARGTQAMLEMVFAAGA
ncbi:MAG: Gfo/Idh/MocA family oxidoreductase [Paracoccaceae bacterium]